MIAMVMYYICNYIMSRHPLHQLKRDIHIEIKHQQVMTYIHQLLNQEMYPHIILISNNVSTCSKILLLIIN